MSIHRNHLHISIQKRITFHRKIFNFIEYLIDGWITRIIIHEPVGIIDVSSNLQSLNFRKSKSSKIDKSKSPVFK